MISAIRKIFSVDQLREKIFFTFAILVVCRLGTYITVPGVNGEEVVRLFQFASGGGQNLFQLVDIFSGGAFAKMTVFALGLVPYISASIMVQLLRMLLPSFQRELKENPESGKRKVGKWTRFLTLFIAIVQAVRSANFVIEANRATPGIIVGEILRFEWSGYPWLFFLLAVTSMTAGTLFLMWLCEMISERGIGNGVSLIISVGILSSFPTVLGSIVKNLNLDSQAEGTLTFTSLLVLVSVFVCIVSATILVIEGQRNIPVQYARRVVGRNESLPGGVAHIPLKLNQAGVMPVIFASGFMFLLSFLTQFLGGAGSFGFMGSVFSPGGFFYSLFYAFLIILVTYFWTRTQFHPEQVASDMKRNGAFIPGIRQGKPTQDYLASVMNKITLAGGVFLAFIATLPTIVAALLSVDPVISNFFGGTSLLILIGVVLDTMKQVESHLVMKRYDGFMSRGR